MATLGQINRLTVSRIGPYSAYLDGGNLGEVMLIKGKSKAVAKPTEGDELEVFVFIDTDDTLVASPDLPDIVAGQLANLEVVALTRDGAFLDWGMKSDLFVPRSEQMGDMAVGKRCVTFAMLDTGNQRMIGSTKLFKHLREENTGDFQSDQQVELMICQQTDLGYKAVINGSHLGMLYNGEIFQQLHVGMKLKGFVKELRPDNKIDLILQKPSVEARSELEDKILAFLKKNDGVSTITDKSPPEEIYNTYAVSKKAYKHAIGGLYRNRLITLSKEQITLIENKKAY